MNFICTNISPERRRLDTLDLGSGHHGIIIRAVIFVLDALFLRRFCNVFAACEHLHARRCRSWTDTTRQLEGLKNNVVPVRMHVLIIKPYIALNVGLA